MKDTEITHGPNILLGIFAVYALFLGTMAGQILYIDCGPKGPVILALTAALIGVICFCIEIRPNDKELNDGKS